MTTAPSKGWFAEVETSTGATHRPAIRGDAQRNPAANDLPSLALPVPRNDDYEHAVFEDAAFRCWFDGVRQPVDTLEDVTVTPDGHRLVGRGGTELLTRVQKEYSQRAIHLAAKDLIEAETPYSVDVDTPVTETETNTTLETLTSNADWLALARLNDTDPVVIESGTLKLGQSLRFSEGENFDRDNGGTLSTVGDYSNGEAWRIEGSGEWIEWDFTTDWPIPEDDVGVAVRNDNENGAATYDLDYYLDGQLIDNLNFDASLTWDQVGDGENSGDGWTGGELPAGSHTVRIENNASSWVDIDCVTLYDKGTRHGGFGYNFDNSATDANDTLAGPELFPDEFQVVFDLIPSAKAVTGIRAEATIDEGASDYTHYVSNDQGDNFTTGTGSNLETDTLGASFGPGVTYKAGLSRTGSGATTTPRVGFAGTDLQSLTLKADLDTTPIVVNQSFDDHLLGILQQLADQGDFTFEARANADGSYTIVWTQPGQRTDDKTASVARFESTRKTGADRQFDKVAVFGSAQSVTGATFEADHGNAVALAKDRLHELKERVYDSDTGEVFVRGVDYSMDYSAGEITVLASGDMADATQYAIDYTWQTFGEFDNGAASPVEGPPQEIPGLTSDRQCQQAARIIVDVVEHPIHEFRLVVPADEAGWSVVEAFDFDQVPTFGQRVEVNDVENTPAQTVLVGNSRRSIGDVVGDIRSRVGRVSRKA